MEWRDDAPDWQDDGKQLKALTKSGSVVVGTLYYDDFINDGADEFPMWRVRFDSGENSSLWDFERWMFA